METFLSQLIFGIQRGTIYALIALGYTRVYGVVRLINFAYGEVFMIGAFAFFFLVNALDFPQPILIVLAFLIPMAVCSDNRYWCFFLSGELRLLFQWNNDT